MITLTSNNFEGRKKPLIEKIKDFLNKLKGKIGKIFHLQKMKETKITEEEEKEPELEPEGKIKKEVEALGKGNFYFTDCNWRVFYRFINAAEKKLDIITNRMSFETFEFLFNKMRNTIQIRIIVGHTPRNYDKINQFIKNRGLNVKVYVCKKAHCKFCIRDEKIILLGSSNMVFTSLGNLQRRGNFEADMISDDPSVVEEASNLFETIWQEKKEYVPGRTSGRFLSSVLGIPSKIEELISESEKELIIFSPNFADKELICALRMLNRNIKIIVVLNWRDKAREKDKEALNLIRDGKAKDGKRLFSIRPKRQSIHAKIYVFDRKRALISSLNLTQPSWGYMIETALLTSDKEIIENITKMIEIFDYKIPSSIKVGNDRGDGEPPEITEVPDEKYLYLETEGKKFLKKCGQLYDEFKTEYGEEFPESIPVEPIEVEAPPTEKEETEKPTEVEARPTEKEETEKPIEVESPPTEKEETEKPIEVEARPTEKEETEKPIEAESPPTEEISKEFIDSAIKQKTAIVMGGTGHWRLGKGFSKKEIERARVERSVSLSQDINTDKRRKTCHKHNIEIIGKVYRNRTKYERRSIVV